MTDVELLSTIHAARLSSESTPPAVLLCLSSLRGSPPDMARTLRLAELGERSAMTKLRRVIASRSSFGIVQRSIAQSLEQRFEAPLAYELAAIHLAFGNHDDAQRLLDQAYLDNPRDPWVLASRMELQQTRGWGWRRIADETDVTTDHPLVWRTVALAQSPNGLGRFAVHARHVASTVSMAQRTDDEVWTARVLDLGSDRPSRWPDADTLPPCEGNRMLGECVALDLVYASLFARQGRWDDAIAILDHLTVVRPWDPSAPRRLAALLERLGQVVPARELRAHVLLATQTLADLTSDEPQAWLSVVSAAMKAGSFPVAVSAARHVTAIAPNLAAGWHRLGQAQLAAGNPDGAADAFGHADALMTKDAEQIDSAPAWGRVALFRWAWLDSPQSAEDAAETALLADSSAAEAWFAMCVVRERDRRVEAQAACLRAIGSAPSWVAPRSRLARLLVGDTRREGVLRDVLVLAPTDSIMRGQLVSHLIEDERFAEAARVALEPLDWPGPNTGVRQELISRLRGLGAVGLDHLLRLILVHPWSGADANYLALEAEWSAAHGEWERAVRLSRKATSLAGDGQAMVGVIELLRHVSPARARDLLTSLQGAAPTVLDTARVETLARKLGAHEVEAWAICRGAAVDRSALLACDVTSSSRSDGTPPR